MNNDNTNNNNELIKTSAFGHYTNVATSFNIGLENSIMEMAHKNEELLMSDILDKFGNYPQVHKSINRLILDNKLVMDNLGSNNYDNKSYELKKISISDPSLSKWLDLAAQPCLTCPIYNECDINNPVSPASCSEFNSWLIEEIDLEYGNNSIDRNSV